MKIQSSVTRLKTGQDGLSASRLSAIIQELRSLATELRKRQEKEAEANPSLSYRLMGQAEMVELLAFWLEGEKNPSKIPASDFGVSLSDLVIPIVQMLVNAGQATSALLNEHILGDKDAD